MIYDLEGRTCRFSKELLCVVSQTKITIATKNIIEQLARCGTSIGANYSEANGASSKRDFRNKIHLCKKESKETEYWIELLAAVEKNNKEKLRLLWKEAHELTLIFNKISHSLNKKNEN